MKNKNVLISGAGIAGPALAYWLDRYGFDVTIVERAPAVREGGQAVDFRGEVHLAVLEKMGILDDIRREQTHGGALTFVDADGNAALKLPASFTGGEVEILRGDLSRILYERTKGAAEYIFDDSITSLTETAVAVHVTFERTEPRVFDLVIGADGLHSNVRRLTFGDESQFIRPSGYHVALFGTGNRLNLDREALAYSEPGRAISVYPTHGNTAANVMCVFAADDLKVSHRDTTRQEQILSDTYTGMGWHTPALMKDLWHAPYFYFDSISTVQMDTYSRGRVTLLGDAGYGATCGGMGTGVAIVCAYVLAGELLAADGDPHTAFPAYEKEIKKFTKACQRVAGGVGPFFAPKTAAKLRRRNKIYRVLTSGPAARFLDKMTTKAATAITLKDYPRPQ